MDIIIGFSVLYLRQIGRGALDPTMKHVENVKYYTEDVVKRSSVKPNVEWLDDWTVRLTLPRDYKWTI